jgi:hypothetical protein
LCPRRANNRLPDCLAGLHRGWGSDNVPTRIRTQRCLEQNGGNAATVVIAVRIHVGHIRRKRLQDGWWLDGCNSRLLVVVHAGAADRSRRDPVARTELNKGLRFILRLTSKGGDQPHLSLPQSVPRITRHNSCKGTRRHQPSSATGTFNRVQLRSRSGFCRLCCRFLR